MYILNNCRIDVVAIVHTAFLICKEHRFYYLLIFLFLLNSSMCCLVVCRFVFCCFFFFSIFCSTIVYMHINKQWKMSSQFLCIIIIKCTIYLPVLLESRITNRSHFLPFQPTINKIQINFHFFSVSFRLFVHLVDSLCFVFFYSFSSFDAKFIGDGKWWQG